MSPSPSSSPYAAFSLQSRVLVFFNACSSYHHKYLNFKTNTPGIVTEPCLSRGRCTDEFCVITVRTQVPTSRVLTRGMAAVTSRRPPLTHCYVSLSSQTPGQQASLHPSQQMTSWVMKNLYAHDGPVVAKLGRLPWALAQSRHPSSSSYLFSYFPLENSFC